MKKDLAEVIDEFEELRISYRNFVKNGDENRNTLLEYQGRFNDLKSSLRPHHAEVSKMYTLHDDKASTGIKYRIAVAISNGEFRDTDEEVNHEKCSITSAEKYASASKKYKEFLTNRAFWKESLININDLRDDISSIAIEISTRLR